MRISNISLAVNEANTSISLYLSKVEAGFLTPTEDFKEGKLDLNQYLITNPLASFFVRVKGDSMMGAGIYEGSLLLVDRSLEPLPGKIIIAVINGELTVKRLKKKMVLLSSLQKIIPIQI